MHTSSALAVIPQPDIRDRGLADEELILMDLGARSVVGGLSSNSHSVWAFQPSIEDTLATIDLVELIA